MTRKEFKLIYKVIFPPFISAFYTPFYRNLN
jgi:hypothetical protein